MLSLVRDEKGQLVYGYGTLVAPDGNASHHRLILALPLASAATYALLGNLVSQLLTS